MSVEILMFIGKLLWAGFTLLLGGIVKHLWSEYKEQKKSHADRLDKLERDIIRLQETAITQGALEEFLKPMREQIYRLENKIDNQFGSLREEQKSDFRELMKAMQDMRLK